MQLFSGLFQIGDEVLINTSDEPDSEASTPGIIVDFGRIMRGRVLHANDGHRPGVYLNHTTVVVLLDNGQKTTFLYIGVRFRDPSLHAARLEAWKHESTSNFDREDSYYVGPLPETPFWEGDRVLVANCDEHGAFSFNNAGEFVITRIDYRELNELMHGVPYPAYTYSDSMDTRWSSNTNAGHLQLVARGRIWNYYHGLPIEFASLQDEADFFKLLGRSKVLTNPRSRSTIWTPSEAVEALRCGIGDTIERMPSLGDDAMQVIWFCDEDLGRRVAKTTMHRLGISR